MKVSVSSVKMLRMAVELSEYFADSEEKKRTQQKTPTNAIVFFSVQLRKLYCLRSVDT